MASKASSPADGAGSPISRSADRIQWVAPSLTSHKHRQNRTRPEKSSGSSSVTINLIGRSSTLLCRFFVVLETAHSLLSAELQACPAMDVCVAAPETHVSSGHLEQYVRQRVHQAIRSSPSWRRISVVGSIRRDAPAVRSDWEKTHRPFDFRRPTATVLDETTIQINCLPSSSLIQHTASVTASFLALEGQSPAIVRAIAPPIDEPLQTLQNSNLAQLEQTDAVIIGQVHKLTGLPPGVWWSGAQEGSQGDLFSWHTYLSPRGKKVTLLGCREALWGEAAAAVARIVRARSGASCIIHVGKVGALRSRYTPNEWLATGQEATVDGAVVRWDGLFPDAHAVCPRVATGVQTTVASPLCETQSWLADLGQRYDWVDCETGHLAAAAKEIGMQFGYLHIISDSLAANYKEDLSNEDCIDVDRKRDVLYRDIESIMGAFLASWG